MWYTDGHHELQLDDGRDQDFAVCLQSSSYYSPHIYPKQLLALFVGQVHRAGDTGIEALDGAQDLHLLLRVMQGVALEGRP
jgi:hypothetical protein